MNTMSARLAGVAGALAMAMTASAGAQCLSVAGWKNLPVRPALSQPAAAAAKTMQPMSKAGGNDINDWFAPIIGMWHVHLVVSSTTGIPAEAAPPAGTEIDAGFQQWHSDGTEMLNSGRPAADTNFCMGVWEQTGYRSFRLNHFTISYTQGPPAAAGEGPTNTLVGPGVITEEVTVSPDGKTFTGRFTIAEYKETDPPNASKPTITLMDTLTGTVTGTRVDMNTAVSPIF